MTKTKLNKTILLALGASILPLGVLAQEAEPVMGAADIEEITILGSRVPGRSLQDSVVPVDVITAKDLAQSGSIGGEIGNLLQAYIPSFNMPRQSNSDQGDVVRAAQLRGLNPDQVLVLVNGKRRHVSAAISVESKLGRGSAAVDFNNIPTSSIKRIEVLRDGAAAQYGSDAIAGVINIVLKNSASEGEISASYGAHMTTLEVIDNEDITDGQTAVISFNKGFSLGDGFINLSGEYRDRSATNRAGYDQLPTIGFAEYIVPVPPSGTPEAAPNDALDGKRNYQIGDGESQDLNLSFNAGLPLSSGAELYSFGTFSDRNAQGSDFFRYPAAEDNNPNIYPNGYIPILDAKITDLSLAAGMKSEYRDWLLDSSLVYGSNTFKDTLTNTLNLSLGDESPTSFNRAQYQYSQMVLNIEGSKNFDAGDTAIYVTTGIELRKEFYETTAGEESSYSSGPITTVPPGTQGGSGLRPEDTVDENRSAFSVFIDAEFELTESLTASTALRYENYSDFGSTVNGKLAGRLELIEGLALRAALSTGFRAPALAQSFFSGTTTSFGDGGALVGSVNLPVSDPVAQENGAQELEPEESVSKSAGLVWSNGDFNFTFDYYQINIDDRIALSETITVDNIPDISGIRFFTNVVDTQTKGFDIVASYDIGNWKLSAAYNQTDTDVVNTPERSVFGIEETNTFETAAPKNKLILSSTWSNDWSSVLFRATQFGETTRIFDFGDDFEPTQVYGKEWVIDADAQFTLSEKMTLAVGVNNLFDEYPDESIFDISYFGNLPYDSGVSPVGVNGRFVYIRSTYRF